MDEDNEAEPSSCTGRAAMTKANFLHDPDVVTMRAWLTDQVEATGHFVHAYIDRKTDQRWTCDGLHDAFRGYSWNGKPWEQNRQELDAFRRTLRAAIADEDEGAAFDACSAILRWGGVWARNGSYLETRRGVLIPELRHLRSVLSSETEPSRADTRRIPTDKSTECRMNAGFVKIYSVLLEYFIIYDGRVGAALGLLARRFCEETNRSTLPEPLRFAYGSPKEGLNPPTPKLRNPSRGPYRFPKLRPDSQFHSVQAMRASWFLRATHEGSGRFTSGEDGFHELAAGLFMIGYDVTGD
jgi:hypothetical protein